MSSHDQVAQKQSLDETTDHTNNSSMDNTDTTDNQFDDEPVFNVENTRHLSNPGLRSYHHPVPLPQPSDSFQRPQEVNF